MWFLHKTHSFGGLGNVPKEDESHYSKTKAKEGEERGLQLISKCSSWEPINDDPDARAVRVLRKA